MKHQLIRSLDTCFHIELKHYFGARDFISKTYKMITITCK